MKVIFVSEKERLKDHRIIEKRTLVERVLVLEDDGSEDGGRTIAKIWKRNDAYAIAKAVGWDVLDELD